MQKKLVVLASSVVLAAFLGGCGMGGGGGGAGKNSVDAVKSALGAKGVSVSKVEPLSDKLGNKAECAPVERKRLHVSGGYVNVGNYGDAGKADACWNAYSGMGAKMDDYAKEGSWILELKDTLPGDTKSKAKDAFAEAID